MKLSIQFACDNAAFGDDDYMMAGAEAARILRDIANKCERRGLITDDTPARVWDANGNNVGSWSVME